MRRMQSDPWETETFKGSRKKLLVKEIWHAMFEKIGWGPGKSNTSKSIIKEEPESCLWEIWQYVSQALKICVYFDLEVYF